jgi:predicted  nucleic acid-binding Zn-ribbon protein
MRTFAAIIIGLCFLYFALAVSAVLLGHLDIERFAFFSSIAGTLASVFGLLSLLKPSITNEDFRKVEIDTLKSLAQTSEELSQLESQRSRTAEEIDNLRIQKKEMELLVKKVAMSFFLNEQQDYYLTKISSIIESNIELRDTLNKLQDTRQRLKALGEEIKSDEKAELMLEVIEASRQKSSELDKLLEGLSPLPRAAAKIFIETTNPYAKLFNMIIARAQRR